MAETSVPRKLLCDFSRMDVDAEGKSKGTVTTFKAGAMITPTDAELAAFADRFEPLTAPPPPEEAPPDETTRARSHR